MPKIKTNKKYAIRLIHPELGEFYYHYNYGNYSYFTQNLVKVKTWKTKKFTEKEILTIAEKLDRKNIKIMLDLSDSIKKEEFKKDCICSRKKYFYPIYFAVSKNSIEKAEYDIDKLDKTLLNDSKFIINLIENFKHVEKDFMPIFKKLYNDISTYRKEYEFLNKIRNSGCICLLDIVDASYNFRLLKLKTLKSIQDRDVNFSLR